MGFKYQPARRIKVTHAEWRVLARKLHVRGCRLDRLQPLRLAGRVCPVPQTINCLTCDKPLEQSRFVAVTDTFGEPVAGLTLNALAQCPGCGKKMLFQRTYNFNVDHAAQGKALDMNDFQPLDLVGWSRWISARRGESADDRRQLHKQRMKARFATGGCMVSWGVALIATGLVLDARFLTEVVTGTYLCAAYEIGVIWASQDDTADQR